MQERIYEYEPLWGEWHVDGLIGEGSFGKVYRVKRVEFGETYYTAVKIITIPQNEAEIRHAYSEGMDSQSVKTYFENFVRDLISEIRLMSNLKGVTNIVSLEDHKIIERKDSIGWDILIRMELLESLPDYLSEHTLTHSEVIKLGIDICRALELCRKYNIIHRDIKPDNIFVSKHGDFKLGDFGIARQIEKTMTGLSKKGTFSYMAPEVYKGQAYNSTVDIYSLGLVLYRFLNNNRTPFLPDYPAPITHSSREEALIRRIRGEALPNPANAEGRLGEIILKACACYPKERYENPGQMRDALEAIQFSNKEAKVIYPEGDSIKIDPEAYISKSSEEKSGEKAERVFSKIVKIIEKKKGENSHKNDKSENKANEQGKPAKKNKRRIWVLGTTAGACILILTAIMTVAWPKLPATVASIIDTNSKALKMGNTAGNINNGGFCSILDGCIYYNNLGAGSKLFKILDDGTGNQKLSDDRAQYINVIGDWIYYSNWTDNKRLYKMRTDGTENQKLSDDRCDYVNAVGEYIYYVNNITRKLCRIDIDGKNMRILNDDFTGIINVAGGWIYFINQSDEDKLYKIRIDGTDRKKINNDDFEYINVAGDWIYYSNKGDDNKLYKLRIDGIGKQKLNDESSREINVVGDWIYYLDAENHLYKINVNGSYKQKLNNDPSEDINVVGDWVYYVNKADNKFYKISIYGKNKQEVGYSMNFEHST